MTLFSKLLGVILCLSLALLVFCFTFVSVFKSNQQLTQALDGADFYTVASKLIANQISAQLIGEDDEINLAKQSIEKGISSELARTTLQPLQIAMIDWLANDQGELRLELDMQTIKTKVTSSVDNADIKFSLTKLIPDQLELTKGDNIEAADSAMLNRVKTLYKTANDSIPVLVLLVAVSSLLLFFINIRKGSKKITSILLSASAASIIGMIMVGISYPLEGFIKVSSSASQQELGVNLALRLLIAIIQQTFWNYIVIGIISISGIIIARFIFKKRDKKLKDKKKK